MCHVLIIEDELLIALDLQAILADAGATSFDLAATEKEAVAAACKRAPAFITSDVRLLEGNGPAAVEQIRRACGDVPVLFITATPDACTPCAPPGRILSKPLDRTQITQAFLDVDSW
jgi:two-component system, response regulator PdtaR